MNSVHRFTPGDNAEPAIPSQAAIAYGIAEIRQHILHLLSQGDLASFMRVEKGCLKDVARELYAKVRYVRVQTPMSTDPIRQDIYSKAIREIDARSLPVTPAMREDDQWREVIMETEDLDGEGTLIHYDARIFNIVVPALRQAYPSLTRVGFGSLDNDQHLSCDARFPSRSSIDTQDGTADKGTVDICAQYTAIIDKKPSRWRPRWQGPSPGPGGNYTVRFRYDITLHGRMVAGLPIINTHDEWLALLAVWPCFETPYRTFTCFSMRLPLDCITDLYRRQDLAGYTDRLHIISSAILPCDITQFETFAKVASASLNKLDIHNAHIWGPRNELIGKPSISDSLAELSTFLSIVRDQLPNLRDLCIGIKGIIAAENDCKALLTQESLRTGGSIKTLRINCRSTSGRPLFNVIRVFSSICNPDAEIAVGQKGDSRRDVNGAANQTAYLQYLRRQPSHCQHHLATFDFPSIDVTSLREVLHLSYDPDGRPWKARESRPWTCGKAITAGMAGIRAGDLLSDMTQFLEEMGDTKRECGVAIERLDEISATAPVWERMAMAQRVMETMETLKRRTARFTKSVDLQAVRRYMELLDEEVKMEEDQAEARTDI